MSITMTGSEALKFNEFPEDYCSPSTGGDEQRAKLENVLREIFPDNAWDDNAADTARRVIKTWREFATISDTLDFEFTTFTAEKGQLIIVRDIEFTSMCAHHLLPFYGVAHVGYIPHKLQVGVSKIPRLVHHYAKRPQVQERLTAQLVAQFSERLATRDVVVVIESRHTCMSCRGVRAHAASMTTSLPKGAFFTSDALRSEFLTLIARKDF